MADDAGAAIHVDDRHVLVEFLIQLGTALINSGEAVDLARRRLDAVAQQAGAEDIDILVFPTALMVQSGEGSGTLVRLTSAAGGARLRLDQVSAVYDLAGRAERGELRADDGLVELAAIVSRSPPFGPVIRTFGLGVLAAGFALALQPTPLGVLGAFVLGTLVGCALLIRLPELQAVMPVVVSFGVASAVFLLAEHYDGENPIRALIPPLVVFLPGAAITTGTMELAAGQTISGASRLVEGLVDLLLLAFGIVAAAALVGAPSTDLLDRPVNQLGAWTSVVALVVIALGNHLHQCAPRRALPWILLVLAVASAGQEFGAAVFAPELSGFFGALAMTPVVLLIGRRRAGPPSMLLFLPAFWLLVPGAAGLIGVTAIVGTSSRLAPANFTATMVTVLAIALGVLIGTAAVRAGSEVRSRAVAVAATTTSWLDRERPPGL
jgi:uncharacterized membrane protein YjjP (DUF1212 family)